MSKVINALGKACPMPVIMTKKEIDQGEESIVTLVDNEVAVENIKRLASSTGFTTHVTKENENYKVTLYKGCEEADEILGEIEKENNNTASDYVVFIGKDHIGEGNDELGINLMRMFLYTLSESDDLPSNIMFMNGGVKLPSVDEQAVKSLEVLMNKGVNILVCGTCLNFFHLMEELKIGSVSNMYEITDKMKQAGKVIAF